MQFHHLNDDERRARENQRRPNNNQAQGHGNRSHLHQNVQDRVHGNMGMSSPQPPGRDQGRIGDSQPEQGQYGRRDPQPPGPRDQGRIGNPQQGDMKRKRPSGIADIGSAKSRHESTRKSASSSSQGSSVSHQPKLKDATGRKGEREPQVLEKERSHGKRKRNSNDHLETPATKQPRLSAARSISSPKVVNVKGKGTAKSLGRAASQKSARGHSTESILIDEDEPSLIDEEEPIFIDEEDVDDGENTVQKSLARKAWPFRPYALFSQSHAQLGANVWDAIPADLSVKEIGRGLGWPWSRRLIEATMLLVSCPLFKDNIPLFQYVLKCAIAVRLEEPRPTRPHDLFSQGEEEATKVILTTSSMKVLQIKIQKAIAAGDSTEPILESTFFPLASPSQLEKVLKFLVRPDRPSNSTAVRNMDVTNLVKTWDAYAAKNGEHSCKHYMDMLQFKPSISDITDFESWLESKSLARLVGASITDDVSEQGEPERQGASSDSDEAEAAEQQIPVGSDIDAIQFAGVGLEQESEDSEDNEEQSIPAEVDEAHVVNSPLHTGRRPQHPRRLSGSPSHLLTPNWPFHILGDSHDLFD